MIASMRKILWTLLVATQVVALEYKPEFENEFVNVARVTIFPHEEIGLHRDPLPEVVIAIKGGTIIRLEADGSTTEVKFPTGEAVFRPADPEDELHKSVNPNDESLELLVIQLKK